MEHTQQVADKWFFTTLLNNEKNDMRWLLFLPLIVLTTLSCGDRNPANSGDGTGTAVIQCLIAPAKAAVSAELKPTIKAEISFYDSNDKRIAYQQLTVSGKRVTGRVKVPAGSGYRAELFCFDRESNPTFGGMATNITAVVMRAFLMESPFVVLIFFSNMRTS